MFFANIMEVLLVILYGEGRLEVGLLWEGVGWLVGGSDATYGAFGRILLKKYKHNSTMESA